MSTALVASFQAFRRAPCGSHLAMVRTSKPGAKAAGRPIRIWSR